MTVACAIIRYYRRGCRAGAAVLGFALVLGLAGCANMGDGMTAAFADPAKYELYDCKQLETERKNLAARQADLQGLMKKAETGAGGPSWPNSPIATNTSRCAASPILPRKPGSATSASPARRRRVPPRRSRRSSPPAPGARRRAALRPAYRRLHAPSHPPVVNPVLPRQHLRCGPIERMDRSRASAAAPLKW